MDGLFSNQNSHKEKIKKKALGKSGCPDIKRTFSKNSLSQEDGKKHSMEHFLELSTGGQ